MNIKETTVHVVDTNYFSCACLMVFHHISNAREAYIRSDYEYHKTERLTFT